MSLRRKRLNRIVFSFRFLSLIVNFGIVPKRDRILSCRSGFLADLVTSLRRYSWKEETLGDEKFLRGTIRVQASLLHDAFCSCRAAMVFFSLRRVRYLLCPPPSNGFLDRKMNL